MAFLFMTHMLCCHVERLLNKKESANTLGPLPKSFGRSLGEEHSEPCLFSPTNEMTVSQSNILSHVVLEIGSNAR